MPTLAGIFIGHMLILGEYAGIKPWCWRPMADKTMHWVSMFIQTQTVLHGMAEAVVGSLILKLGDALVNEVVELAGPCSDWRDML